MLTHLRFRSLQRDVKSCFCLFLDNSKINAVDLELMPHHESSCAYRGLLLLDPTVSHLNQSSESTADGMCCCLFSLGLTGWRQLWSLSCLGGQTFQRWREKETFIHPATLSWTRCCPRGHGWLFESVVLGKVVSPNLQSFLKASLDN